MLASSIGYIVGVYSHCCVMYAKASARFAKAGQGTVRYGTVRYGTKKKQARGSRKQGRAQYGTVRKRPAGNNLG